MIPNSSDVNLYLGDDITVSTGEVGDAFFAEKAAQKAVCRVPAEGVDWPDDLAIALYRRVAANLARKHLPLGLSVAMGEATTQVTRVGMDAEVRRLEAPWRRLVVG